MTQIFPPNLPGDCHRVTSYWLCFNTKAAVGPIVTTGANSGTVFGGNPGSGTGPGTESPKQKNRNRNRLVSKNGTSTGTGTVQYLKTVPEPEPEPSKISGTAKHWCILHGIKDFKMVVVCVRAHLVRGHFVRKWDNSSTDISSGTFCLEHFVRTIAYCFMIHPENTKKLEIFLSGQSVLTRLLEYPWGQRPDGGATQLILWARPSGKRYRPKTKRMLLRDLRTGYWAINECSRKPEFASGACCIPHVFFHFKHRVATKHHLSRLWWPRLIYF